MKQFAITIKPDTHLKLAPRTLLSDYQVYPTEEQAETVMRNLNPKMIDKHFFMEGAADSMKVMELDPNVKKPRFGVKDIVVMDGSGVTRFLPEEVNTDFWWLVSCDDLTGFFPEDINTDFWWLVSCDDMDLRANIAAERKVYIKYGDTPNSYFGVERLGNDDGNREKIGTFVKWIIERLPEEKEFATYF